MRREQRKQLSRLYKRFDAVSEKNAGDFKLTPDVELLQEIEHIYKLATAPTITEIQQMKFKQELMTKAYEYYQLTGSLPHEFLDNSVSLPELIQAYHQSHRIAFNEHVQLQVHEFLVLISQQLQELQSTANVQATIDQYEEIRQVFSQVLVYILMDGFALDRQVYQDDIQPVWMPIQNSRMLTARDFKPLVRELDRYTRLETGRERRVVYTPDVDHQVTTVDNQSIDDDEALNDSEINEIPSSHVIDSHHLSMDGNKVASDTPLSELDHILVDKNENGQLKINLPKIEKRK